MQDSLAELRSHYLDRTRAARAWKAGGGRVVGYVCDNVPVELVAAAGFFPLRISGWPAADAPTVRAHVDTLYPPDLTNRPGFAEAILENLLNGAYGVVDYLIIPHNRNAIQAMYRELSDAAAHNDSLPKYEMHYLDKAWSSSFVSEVFNRDEVIRLKETLETWSGSEISDETLRRALDLHDENRRLLGRLAALRAEIPARVSGVDALQIIGASMVMAKDAHNEALAQVLNAATAAPPRDGPRLFVGGSPLDHTRVYEVIESCGATVVAEDHCWGNRAGDLSAPASASPLLELASRFHQRPACSIAFPLSRTVNACARRATSAAVDGAVFYVMDQDWAQNWETPKEVELLKTAGVPTLHLSRQAYDGGDPDALKAAILAFLPQCEDAARRAGRGGTAR